MSVPPARTMVCTGMGWQSGGAAASSSSVPVKVTSAISVSSERNDLEEKTNLHGTTVIGSSTTAVSEKDHPVPAVTTRFTQAFQILNYYKQMLGRYQKESSESPAYGKKIESLARCIIVDYLGEGSALFKDAGVQKIRLFFKALRLKNLITLEIENGTKKAFIPLRILEQQLMSYVSEELAVWLPAGNESDEASSLYVIRELISGKQTRHIGYQALAFWIDHYAIALADLSLTPTEVKEMKELLHHVNLDRMSFATEEEARAFIGEFPNMTTLYLNKLTLTENIDRPLSALPITPMQAGQLKTLYLSDEGISVLPTMPHLNNLDICCPRLIALPALPNLKNLVCCDCTDLKFLYESNMPTLKTLFVWDCPNLGPLPTQEWLKRKKMPALEAFFHSGLGITKWQALKQHAGEWARHQT